MHWNNEQKVDTFTIQGCWCRKNIYIFGNVAFYTFKCYKKRKRTKKPFISLNDFFWWLSRNKRPKEPFCLSFLFFKYWNKSKEKEVPYFSSWSLSPVSRQVSSSLGIRVSACYSAAQYVKADKREIHELMVWINIFFATLPWYKFAKSDTVKNLIIFLMPDMCFQTFF